MRYKVLLDDNQLRFLVKNNHLSNIKLAEMFGVKPNTIAVYKARARKAGIDIPKQRKDSVSTVDKMLEFSK